jgi:hypothetical protein
VAKSGATYEPRITQRPQVGILANRSVHEVFIEDKDCDPGDSQEEQLEEWHRNQVNAVHFEQDN